MQSKPFHFKRLEWGVYVYFGLFFFSAGICMIMLFPDFVWSLALFLGL